MNCPECQTELVLGEGTERYQTLNEHVCNPNATPPERRYYVCPNTDCCLRPSAFWDDWGDIYTRSREGIAWCWENGIDSNNLKTHQNKGTEALNSGSRQVTEDMVRSRRMICNRLRKRYRRMMRPIHHVGCELRRSHLPTALWRDNSSRWHRFWYSIGILMLDFWGTRWKFHVRWKSPENCQDDWCLKQWLHHPFPWVRWSVRRWLAGKAE